MTNRKPLYLAVHLEQLNDLIKKSSYGRKLDMLFRVSDTLYHKTIKIHTTEPLDEELLYILCVRYLNLVNSIRVQVKDDNFHKTRFSKSIASIEEIKKLCEDSLQSRYMLNENPAVAAATVNIEDAMANIDKPNTSLALIKEDDKFIDVHVFYKLITDDQIKLLIMDARNTADFNDCCIKHPNVINIPDEVIRKGLSTNTLQEKLIGENVEAFKKRHTFDLIVLLNSDTTRISYPSSKLEDLRCILVDWDLDPKYQALPVILDGGIRAWIDSYPTLLTNPGNVYNQLFRPLDDLMDDIEYPEVLAFGKPAQEVKIETIEKPEIPEPEDEPVKDDFPSTVVLQNILTVAEQQVQIEEKLLNYAKRRCAIKEIMVKDKSRLNTGLLEMKGITGEVSKTESYKIELDERRNLLDAEYNRIKTENDVNLLCEMLNDINTLDKKKLLKYQMRKTLELKEEQCQKELIGNKSYIETLGPEYKTVVKPKKIPPKVPDRKTKPGEQPLLQQIAILRDRFKDTGVTGLMNIRNTCYLNSLVQCLRFCPTFLYFFITNPIDKARMRMSHHLGELIKKMWSENKVALRPSNFYAEVCSTDNYEKGYANGCHEDVQEFFIFVTKALHKELQTPFESNTLECTAKLIDWHKTFESKNSFINRTFFFQMEFTSTCGGCRKSYIKYDYGNTIFISLPPNGNPINLNDKIRDFSEVTDEEQETCKYCSRCEMQMTLKKKITYYPSILAINIVRYDFSKIERCILRRNNECCFQKELYFGRGRYELKSISLHSGNRDVGHYTALCRHPFDTNKWIEFNDQSANFVNADDPIYKVQSYMLFYTLTQSSDEVNKNFFQH